MQVIKITTRPMMSNTYVFFKEGERQAIVVDPAFEGDRIIRCLEEEELTCQAILLTHGHFDHIAAVDELRDKYGALAYIHQLDADMLGDPEKNAGGLMGMQLKIKPADRLVQDRDVLHLAGLDIVVLHTPGHTPGSACYIVEGCIFTGDTLFAASIGRTDFPGGSMEQMMASLEKLRNLQGDYIVYPGHMESSSLAHERENNPYMNQWPLT